jgi:hypothetical protein
VAALRIASTSFFRQAARYAATALNCGLVSAAAPVRPPVMAGRRTTAELNSFFRLRLSVPLGVLDSGFFSCQPPDRVLCNFNPEATTPNGKSMAAPAALLARSRCCCTTTRTPSLRAAADGLHLARQTVSLLLPDVAKILGGVAIIVPVPRLIREWAYAGSLSTYVPRSLPSSPPESLRPR